MHVVFLSPEPLHGLANALMECCRVMVRAEVGVFGDGLLLGCLIGHSPSACGHHLSCGLCTIEGVERGLLGRGILARVQGHAQPPEG